MTPVYQEKLHNSLWLWKMVMVLCRWCEVDFEINDSDKEALKISKLLSQNHMQKNETFISVKYIYNV